MCLKDNLAGHKILGSHLLLLSIFQMQLNCHLALLSKSLMIMIFFFFFFCLCQDVCVWKRSLCLDTLEGVHLPLKLNSFIKRCLGVDHSVFVLPGTS